MTTRPATVEQVAWLYRKRRSYIYRLAYIHQWRRIRHQGRVYYDLNDVDRDLGADASACAVSSQTV
jgi:SH3-like domain-containing protein